MDLHSCTVNTVDEFEHFDDFFTRALKPTARPIATHKTSLISPVDGILSQIGNIQQDTLLQSKNKQFTLQALCGRQWSWLDEFANGTFMTIYLAPENYHRIHMPMTGTLRETVYLPAQLFPVNPDAVQTIDNLFIKNERLVCLFDSDNGPFMLVLIAALIVSGIETVWEMTPPNALCEFQHCAGPQITLKKGAEMGRFHIGSTVIFCTPESCIEPDKQLQLGAALRMGQKIGRIRSSS